MPKSAQPRNEDLPPDNGARLAIFDALASGVRDLPGGSAGLTRAELTDRVIGRLRVLVPQELFVNGEQNYVNIKIDVCLAVGIVRWNSEQPSRLVLGDAVPRVRYPDGTLRDYTSGVEGARERLDRDDYRLRRAGFNVRHIIKPASNRRKSDGFRRLLDSMREHGFLEQFPLTESPTAGIIDGLARQAAAAEVGIVLNPKKHIVRVKRRDTLLHHALFVLDVNAERLTEDEVANVHQTIAERVQRPWIEIEDDLELTREWRRAEPREYDVKFEVALFRYSGQDEPKVQVTTDHTRVMLRSLMLEAGIAEYHRDLLKPYVPMEEARTQYSGRKAIFVHIDEAIDGIGRMQRARVRQHLKIDTAWDDMQKWLVETFRQSHASGEISPSTDSV